MPGLINVDKWLTQLGQLEQNSGFDQYGQPTTNVVTISCFVYDTAANLGFSQPGMVETGNYFAIVPSTIDADVGYKLNTVVDSGGTTVLAQSEVTRVSVYSHWKYKIRFQALELNINA